MMSGKVEIPSNFVKDSSMQSTPALSPGMTHRLEHRVAIRAGNSPILVDECLIFLSGRVAEWFKAPVLKTGRPRKGSRGFESHPFRHIILRIL
jgi:hypothetical protein